MALILINSQTNTSFGYDGIEWNEEICVYCVDGDQDNMGGNQPPPDAAESRVDASPETLFEIEAVGSAKRYGMSADQLRAFLLVYDKAPAAKVEVDDIADGIAKAHHGRVAKTSLKSPDRAIDKIINDYDGDADKIKDLARNTIIVDANQISAVTDNLENNGARIKVIDGATDPLGYSGVITTIKTQAGITAEIQINTPAMIYAKEPEPIARQMLGGDLYNQTASRIVVAGGRGHEIYEKWRTIPDGPERLALEEQSRAYYNSIREAANAN